MGANLSEYTKDSPVPVVMRDYPWTETITPEQWNLDIPIELSIWGVLGLFFMVGSKLSAVAIHPNFSAPAGFPFTVIGYNEMNP